MKPHVLLVEGEGGRGDALTGALASRFDCRRVASFDGAMAALHREPWAVVVANYHLADGSTGLEILQAALAGQPRAFRILYAENTPAGLRQDARRLGQLHHVGEATAADFVPALEGAIARLLAPPPAELPSELPPILTEVIVSQSPLVGEFLAELRVAAERDAPVYVYGEPGAGVTRSGIMLRRWRREWRERGSPAVAAGDAPVCILRMPSVRERLQDLPLLVARCLLEDARQRGEPLRRLSPDALRDLTARPWFGNVIELATLIARAVQRAGPRPVIRVEDLPTDADPPWRPSQCAKDAGQRDCVLRQLRVARNVSAAARLEGCSRANYIRLMRRLGIVRADMVTEVTPCWWRDAARLGWRAPRQPVSALSGGA